MDKENTNDRLIMLLDRLAGEGKGQEVLQQLLHSDKSVQHIAENIATSTAFECLYKEVRTCDIVVEGLKEADAAFVGMPELPDKLSFEEKFRQYFQPRLEKRADGFAAIFDALPKPLCNLLILETGCLRIPGNWEGDGQSTFMFDALARDCGGLFFSIDVLAESIDTARRACSSATHLILNDSVTSLYALSRVLPTQASLIYFDSYDVDLVNPLPSAIHHVLELSAARPLIGPGTIVCIDDYGFGSEGGKGMILDKFFSNIRAEVIYCGYQKVWRVS